MVNPNIPRHHAGLKLQYYDPRLGTTAFSKDPVTGKTVTKPKFPLKWGHGFFYFKDMPGSEGKQTFVYETRKKLLVHTGTKGATILWREFLKEVSRYPKRPLVNTTTNPI